MAGQVRTNFDIIINGGGIVGFSLLNSLLSSSHLSRLRVLLIEQSKRPPSFKQHPRVVSSASADAGLGDEQDVSKSFSNRVSSITRASRQILESSGVWSHVKPFAKDVSSIQVWNYDYNRRMTFNQSRDCSITRQSDDNVMFCVVENDRLSSAILSNIESKQLSSGHPIKWDHTLEHLSESTDRGMVDVLIRSNVSGEEMIASAPLVLGCDGFNSKVRQFMRMKYNEIDLNKTAVVGTVKMLDSVSNNDEAYQRFSPEKDAVAALLPLDEQYCSFVISAANDYAKHLMECDDESFSSEFNRLLTAQESPQNPILGALHNVSGALADRFEELADRIWTGTSGQGGSLSGRPPQVESVIAESRASFPLRFGTTSPRMIAKLPGRQHYQFALLGDSSHRVHPLAGQGLNLGIQDAALLVELLERLAKIGERPFDQNDLHSLSKALKSYELYRQAYILPMSAGILAMPYLFNLTPPALISLADRCRPMKEASVRFANGCSY